MAITAKDVAELRAKTGIGMMECKKALTEANGDMEEAIKLLREKGMAVADKKASRIAAEGIVAIYAEGTKTAMIEVNSETDFVAKNASFQEFVNGLLKTVIETGVADVDALLAAKFTGEDRTVDEVLKEKIFTIGEKLTIRRFVVVEGISSSYVHGGGTIGVIVTGDTATDNDDVHAILKNVALQIAAMEPEYLNRNEVPANVVEEEKGIILEQMKNDPKMAGKPEKVLEGIVMGKIGKFYSKVCLLEQEYVKDESMSVEKYVAAAAKEAGVECAVKSFVIYKKGEGLQKREENFAEEIAKLTGKQ
ncbi:MAG: elongation factor Ts [Clostridia bacterium]|nr:elongation factor Ts [Clostridia bacterium]